LIEIGFNLKLENLVALTSMRASLLSL
jgi:hypothetical protein